ncbi:MULTISPECIES: Flp family type IVb pilin [unclassified Bradyrhizobium]
MNWRAQMQATSGLIAVGIALAIITVVNGMGSKLNAKFGSISSSLK